MLRGFAAPIALLLLTAQPAAAHYYSITSGGAQLHIGDAPLPLQKTAGTGTVFPPLLIPPNPDPAKALILQTAGPDPKRMAIPPGALLRNPPGPQTRAHRNPFLIQIRTRIQLSAPAAGSGSAVLSAGGRTGAATTTFVSPGPDASAIRYVKTAAQFGGPARIKVLPATALRIWAPGPGFTAPCKHPVFGGADANCTSLLLAAHPATAAAPGANFGSAQTTPGTPPAMSPGVVAVSVPNPANTTRPIAQSASIAMTAPATNMATSYGFPWTTGRITISAPSAAGSPELFTLTGMDSRVNGVGTISLVSGALSTRAVSGPNANRGWLRFQLPEPGAAIGALSALATLLVCHALVRRRAERGAA